MRARTPLSFLLLPLWIVSCGEIHAGHHDELRSIADRHTRRELVRFRSERELRRYVEDLAPALVAQRMASLSFGAAPASEESITNNQEAGVDEGGLVKVHGDHLVILRRGRLFTVRIGDGELRPIAAVDAHPPGVTSGWYDELLILGDTVIVVGHDYERGRIELGLFDIDARGALHRRSTHYLRSNDYYSSRNYASRLVGDQLVLYVPHALFSGGSHSLPALRTHGGGGFGDLVRATEIYRPVQPTAHPTLHTVVRCDLSRPELACTARAILGPWARSFFVSRDAVYVWVRGEWRTQGMPDGVVYRLPFDDGAPGAVRVAGMPTDQLSFQERDGHLNVLVRAEALGDSMWAPEIAAGDVALVRVPLALFTDRLTTAPRSAYVPLPRVSQRGSLQNRFVGAHLLYGTGGGWGPPSQTRGPVFVHAVDTGTTTRLSLPHGVDRIEGMGSDAVVVGAGGGDLYFSAISLGPRPVVDGHHALPAASQGETRSHGFFFRPDGESSGVLGLPIRDGADAGWEQLVRGSAGVVFLRVDRRRFEPLGRLDSVDANVDDDCRVSCVDWYGNARPIFLRGRVFALLGYELVEGRVHGGAIREIGRTHFFLDGES